MPVVNSEFQRWTQKKHIAERSDLFGWCKNCSRNRTSCATKLVYICVSVVVTQRQTQTLSHGHWNQFHCGCESRTKCALVCENFNKQKCKKKRHTCLNFVKCCAKADCRVIVCTRVRKLLTTDPSGRKKSNLYTWNVIQMLWPITFQVLPHLKQQHFL